MSFQINTYNSKEFDEDMDRLDKLALINASARFDLLSANQQLLDFQLSKILKSKDIQYKETQQNADKPLRVDTADDENNQDKRKWFKNPVEVIQNRLKSMSPLSFNDDKF